MREITEAEAGRALNRASEALAEAQSYIIGTKEIPRDQQRGVLVSLSGEHVAYLRTRGHGDISRGIASVLTDGGYHCGFGTCDRCGAPVGVDCIGITLTSTHRTNVGLNAAWDVCPGCFARFDESIEAWTEREGGP